MLKTKTQKQRPKTQWSKTKTHLKPFFYKEKRERHGRQNLTVTLSQSVQRLSKVRNSVKFQQYRNIIFRDDLV